MTSVFLLTTGSYSDYKVVGVFSTLEKAEAAKLLWSYANDIDEMDLDEEYDCPPGMVGWWVRMHRDGDVNVAERSDPWEDDNIRELPGRWCIYYVWATDRAHAIKIANERRTQAIAEGRI